MFPFRRHDGLFTSDNLPGRLVDSTDYGWFYQHFSSALKGPCFSWKPATKSFQSKGSMLAGHWCPSLHCAFPCPLRAVEMAADSKSNNIVGWSTMRFGLCRRLADDSAATLPTR